MSQMSELDILLKRLEEIADRKSSDHTNDHIEADWALLRFINVPEITKAFRVIPKWYA